MAELITDRRDLEFVLWEQLDTQRILDFKPFDGINKAVADMVIKEARALAIKEILSTYAPGDREGVSFDQGIVRVPECFRRAHRLLSEGDWGALTEDPDWGGQGLPHIIAQAAMEYLIGASFSVMSFVMLGHGAGKMIELYGTDFQKDLFLKKLYSLEWGGSMLLTEPQAGSDLGALETRAVKNSDGTYTIVGNKQFITNGDQNLTENIIHPVLARIEGAPAGTRGISIFIVPKHWVNDDGTLGEPNDIVCTGIEDKLGLHGSPTCSLALGSKGQCRGYLLGKENQGMEIMFHMMNEVRLEVGIQALTHASSAYLYALDYAKKRYQGRDIEARQKDAPQVPIINHPDIRRMLTRMKAYVEGMRSLAYFTSWCIDMAGHSNDPKVQSHHRNLTEILTPIVKAYCSEKGYDVCVDAMQIFGGYGYTRDYPVEQILRDCKITSIYEGSNGIQAMDFLGRKLTMNHGAALKALIQEIKDCTSKAKEMPSLETMGQRLDIAVERLETACIGAVQSLKSSIRSAFAYSHPLQEAAGDVIMAWMLLWRAIKADAALKNSNFPEDPNQIEAYLKTNRQAAFYHGKILTAHFFIHTQLPATLGKLDAIIDGDNAAVRIHENSF